MISKFFIAIVMFFNVHFGSPPKQPTKAGANKPPAAKTVIIVDINPQKYKNSNL